MSAPDFYFAVNAIARHILDEYGKEVLIEYWRSLGQAYYRPRTQRWRDGGVSVIAKDWQTYFLNEPGAEVEVSCRDATVELNVITCPAIKHLEDNGREIVPCYCEHCDHTCGAMAESAGFRFERDGGGGSCRQRFVLITPDGGEVR